MKTMRIGLVAACLALVVASAWGDLAAGSTREEVIAALGKPTGTAKRGATEFMYYGGSVVEIKDGKVVQLHGELTSYAENRSKGLIQVNGKWVTPTEKQKMEEEAAKQAELKKALGPKIKILSDGGKKVDLKDLVVPGKITIVDFYADWCGPCKAMAPQLEAMANDDADIYLRKVDIVNWDTDVAHQYDLHAIPNVRVFNRKGDMVGEPSYNINDITSYTMKAR